MKTQAHAIRTAPTPIPLKTQHLLSGDELSAAEITALIDFAIQLKLDSAHTHHQHAPLSSAMQSSSLPASSGSVHLPSLPPLPNACLALLFDKPSFRTRISFIVAMQQLGGYTVESVSDTRKTEYPEDQIRVLNGYCDAVMVRTHSDHVLEAMVKHSRIPVINGLSALYHPCQILADLMTIKEYFHHWTDLTVSYIGDGNNILHSWLLMAPQLGIRLRYACPPGHEPHSDIVHAAQAKAPPGLIQAVASPAMAVTHSHAVYTDVWTSMGFHASNEAAFDGYQVNETHMALAAPNAIFMHCMPMERGKEVSATLPDQPCSVVFQQSENRYHVQKALLWSLLQSRCRPSPSLQEERSSTPASSLRGGRSLTKQSNI